MKIRNSKFYFRGNNCNVYKSIRALPFQLSRLNTNSFGNDNIEDYFYRQNWLLNTNVIFIPKLLIMRNILILSLILNSIFCFSQEPKSYSGNYDELYRPAFHFSPQSMWMNDPNGLIFYNGKYHLFYQYYPKDIVWGPMHWGHAESTDLIHWKHLPIALYPDSLGYIFSGSAVIDKNNTSGFGKNAMVAIFTYHNEEMFKQGRDNIQSQGIAYSLDEGKTWTKYRGNPVLNNTGEKDFRDPKVFWNEKIEKWNMVLAAGDRIKIFSSSDLKTWQFESNYQPKVSEVYGVWECPDLFKMKVDGDEKWIMILSHNQNAANGGSGTKYVVGDFDGKNFVALQEPKWLDYGTDNYAGVSFSNVPGNKIIILSWMSNWDYATKTPTEVWRSAMTLPRELELVHDVNSYYLSQKVVEQFSSIMVESFKSKNLETPFIKKNLDLSQTCISFQSENIQNLVITFFNDKNEKFTIELADNQIITNRNKSGKIDFSDKFASKAQVMSLENVKINSFQLILDKSSIEILVNDGRFSMTNLFFPIEKYTSLNIDSKKKTIIRNLNISNIKNAWKSGN